MISPLRFVARPRSRARKNQVVRGQSIFSQGQKGRSHLCGDGAQTAKHDADEQKRQADAQALSHAIDPFTKSIDLSKCEE